MNNKQLIITNKNTSLALHKSKSLLNISNKILNSKEIIDVQEDDNWIERLWAWADENNIQDIKWIDNELYLDEGHFNGLPREKAKLMNLTDLNLSGNLITEIPKEIGNLVNLTHLNLTINEIIEIPKEIGNLVNLTHLSLIANKIIEIPKEIGNLVNLTHLYLTGNEITEIPKEIGNLVSLSKLDLSLNKITEIPKEINILKANGCKVIL